MIYVYRRASSNAARELAEALEANARRINDLTKAHFGKGVRAGDVVICYGEQLDPINGVRILNGSPMMNKLEAATRLREAGVPTVEVSRTRPAAGPTDDPAVTAWQAVMREVPHPLNRQAIQTTIDRMTAALRQPVPVPATWLARRFNHVGGNDLLRPGNADYYAKKEAITEEYRIHCFNGKSIRAGVKVPREDARPHEWIRSFDGGWKISYDNFKSKQAMRDLAAGACEALRLDFGAVDIAKKSDGTLFVLEVNRAPGLEGNTIDVYANAVTQWLNGGTAEEAR